MKQKSTSFRAAQTFAERNTKPPEKRGADASYFHQIYYRGLRTAQKRAFRQPALYLVQPPLYLENLAFAVGKNPLVHRFEVVNIRDVYAVKPPVNAAAKGLPRALREEADTLDLFRDFTALDYYLLLFAVVHVFDDNIHISVFLCNLGFLPAF